MADSKGIKAGQAFVELFANDNPLRQGLDKARAHLSNWGKSITALGTTIAAGGALLRAPLELSAHLFADMGAEMAAMSARTGVTVENLSALAFAAEQSGVSAEGLEHGLRHLQREIGKAAGGGKEAQQVFQKLGINLKEIGSATGDKQLEMFAAALQKIPEGAQRTAAAMGVMGRNGTMLLPLLNKGAEGIEELKRQAAELGVVMSTESAQAAAAFKHEMAGLWTQLKMVGFTVGSAVAPEISKLIAQIRPAITQAIAWAKENWWIIVPASASRFYALLCHRNGHRGRGDGPSSSSPENFAGRLLAGPGDHRQRRRRADEPPGHPGRQHRLHRLRAGLRDEGGAVVRPRVRRRQGHGVTRLGWDCGRHQVRRPGTGGEDCGQGGGTGLGADVGENGAGVVRVDVQDEIRVHRRRIEDDFAEQIPDARHDGLGHEHRRDFEQNRAALRQGPDETPRRRHPGRRPGRRGTARPALESSS